MRLVIPVVAMVALAAGASAQPKLSLTQEVLDGKNGITTLDNTRDVAISTPDGAFVYAVASGDQDDALTVFSRSLTTGHLTLVEAEREGVNGVSGLDGGLVVEISPDGAHVYVAGTGIVVFSRDGITGAVTYESTAGYPDRPSAMAFSPNGEHLYVTSDVPAPDAEITVYARDGITGALTLVQQVSDNQGGVDGIDRASAVAVSPDGGHVYVAGRFDDAVAAFERDLVTGELTFLQQYVDGAGGIVDMRRPEAVLVSPDGAHVYVGGSDPSIVRFDRDAGTGLLAFADATSFGSRAVSLSMSADGTRMAVAATSGDPDQVHLVARDTGTGALSLSSQEAYESIRGVAISPDGSSIYAPAPEGVAVFRVVTTACSATPLPGCLLPTLAQKSSLQLKDDPLDDTRDRLTSKWVKGTAFAIGDLGDPIAQPDDVFVCVYDASADPQPVLAGLLPGLSSCRGKPCWKANTAGTKLKYSDPDLLPDGIRSLVAKGGATGLTSVKVKGKSTALPMPTLPLTTPVRAQVQATATGACWEAVFSTPTLNDSLYFKAKAD